MGWVGDRVLHGELNPTLSALADRYFAEPDGHGNYIGQIAADFGRHGFCATKSQRWANSLGDALGLMTYAFNRHLYVAAFHPNRPGHQCMGERVAARLHQYLYAQFDAVMAHNVFNPDAQIHPTGPNPPDCLNGAIG